MRWRRLRETFRRGRQHRRRGGEVDLLEIEPFGHVYASCHLTHKTLCLVRQYLLRSEIVSVPHAPHQILSFETEVPCRL